MTDRAKETAASDPQPTPELVGEDKRLAQVREELEHRAGHCEHVVGMGTAKNPPCRRAEAQALRAVISFIDKLPTQPVSELLGEERERREVAEEALLSVAAQLAKVGPDEVLDQDIPAEEGRRWIISHDKGLRITAACTTALETLKRYGLCPTQSVSESPGDSGGALFRWEGADGHRVVLEFDGGGGPYMTLLHPESGCAKPTVCASCARDLLNPESEGCYDCKDGLSDDDCWLTSWFKELRAEELLHGRITVAVTAEWDQDHPKVTIDGPDLPNLTHPVPGNSGGVEEGWPELLIARDDDGAMEIAEAGRKFYTDPCWEFCRYVPTASTQPRSPQAEVQDCENCGGKGWYIGGDAPQDETPIKEACENCNGTGVRAR